MDQTGSGHANHSGSAIAQVIIFHQVSDISSVGIIINAAGTKWNQGDRSDGVKTIEKLFIGKNHKSKIITSEEVFVPSLDRHVFAFPQYHPVFGTEIFHIFPGPLLIDRSPIPHQVQAYPLFPHIP